MTSSHRQPVFHVQQRGGYANQMIQYLVALSVADRVSNCLISNIDLVGWNISHPKLTLPRTIYKHIDPQHADVASLAALLNTGGIDCIDYSGYGQRIENFLPAARYRDVFRSEYTHRLGWGPNDIVFSIRGGEVLDGRHPGYVLIPLDYYDQLIQETGLNPVFMGQVGTDIYSQALRRRFSGARFVGSMGPLMDFEALRGSVNVVPSISTFSWLACWLSRAENIFMPLTGLFNPAQFPDHDFAPVDDARFRFTWFPANYGVPVADFELNHRSLAGRWRRIGRDEVTRLKTLKPVVPRSKDQHVAFFEEETYRRKYPDVEAAVQRGLPSALLHYIRSGFAERREPFRMNKAWYARTYPDAADAIGRGEYHDIYHHYAATGSRLGYRRTPDQQLAELAS